MWQGLCYMYLSPAPQHRSDLKSREPTWILRYPSAHVTVEASQRHIVDTVSLYRQDTDYCSFSSYTLVEDCWIRATSRCHIAFPPRGGGGGLIAWDHSYIGRRSVQVQLQPPQLPTNSSVITRSKSGSTCDDPACFDRNGTENC
jgi:hypothetical protein